MPTLLHINVSPRGNYSISRQLGAAAVQAWQKSNLCSPFVRTLPRFAAFPVTFL
jgi:FMN-dependent NADH-azoreductase